MRQETLVGAVTAEGEILNGVAVFLPHKQAAPYKNFAMMNLDNLRAIAADKALTGETLRVLVYLMGRLDYQNYLNVRQSEIAQQLGIYQSNVSKALKLLIERKIILGGPKIGPCKTYVLGTEYAWRGNRRTLQEARTVKPAKPKQTLEAVPAINGSKESDKCE